MGNSNTLMMTIFKEQKPSLRHQVYFYLYF